MKPEREEIPENEKAHKRRKLLEWLKLGIQRAKKDKPPTPESTRRRRPRWARVGYLFMYFGVISLAASILYNSSILAFIGLSLTLWGGLFLFIKPTKYVKLSVLDSATMSSFIDLDKILGELNFEGQGVHLPPRLLKELKEGIAFVPMKQGIHIPKAEELAKERIFLNPEGICLTPPGQGLMNLYEKELGIDFSKTDLKYLRSHLPKLLVEDLEILEDLEINEQDDGLIYVKMKGSVHVSLCSQFRSHPNIFRLGCPLCSSLACALARATGKPVAIERNDVSIEGATTETWYRLIEEN